MNGERTILKAKVFWSETFLSRLENELLRAEGQAELTAMECKAISNKLQDEVGHKPANPGRSQTRLGPKPADSLPNRFIPYDSSCLAHRGPKYLPLRDRRGQCRTTKPPPINKSTPRQRLVQFMEGVPIPHPRTLGSPSSLLG